MSDLIENKKINKEEDKKEIKYKRKWDYTREELRLWPNEQKIPVVYRKNKYGSCSLSFDIVPNLTITYRVDPTDYYALLKDTNSPMSAKEVSFNSRYRLLEGSRKDNGEPYYMVEFLTSINFRLSFLIEDKVIRTLSNLDELPKFIKINDDLKEFGLKEVEM